MHLTKTVRFECSVAKHCSLRSQLGSVLYYFLRYKLVLMDRLKDIYSSDDTVCLNKRAVRNINNIKCANCTQCVDCKDCYKSIGL